MRATVIIPFHRNLQHLDASLAAVRRSLPDAEVLIAADGAVENCRALADANGAQVVTVPGPQGPAVARNRAAARASGDVLLFVDADVVVAPTALPGMCALLAAEPALAGVFGAYDLSPREQDFMSQDRNLSHAYVHDKGRPQAWTFWAGLGAIRADAFRAAGGFDERFRRPSIEDIELGYRLVSCGHSIRLDVRFRGQHLKRWTMGSSITTDLLMRGIPWTQLIYRSRGLSNDLNLGVVLRLSVVLTVALAATLAHALIQPSMTSALVPVALLGALVGLNFPYYRWFARQRGIVFATKVIPLHLVHHACNAVSFVVGTILHVAGRCGWTLPGALPIDVWRSGPIQASGSPGSPS